MRNQITRARTVVGAVIGLAVGAMTLSACDHLKDEFLKPQNPGTVDGGQVGSPSAAAALKIGAMGKLKLIGSDPSPSAGFAYSSIWVASGLMTDEFSNSDFQNSQNDIDARTMSPDNGASDYGNITQARGFIREAITAETKYEPQKTADIGELYLALAFTEMTLAENFCSGIPLGSNNGININYNTPEFKPLTNAEVYAKAREHIDSALTVLGTATDAASTAVRQATLITEARIIIDQATDQNRAAQTAAAAALVPASTVPSTFQYLWSTSTANNSDDLGIWQFNNSVGRMTVGDSVITYAGKTYQTLNAIPFASSNDPRVPVATGKSLGLSSEDGTTPFFLQQIWKNRDDPQPMVSGIDARLIEAEAALNNNNIPGMMTILNALRATPPKIGTFQPAAMGNLATPATFDDATSLFFREKAFWTYGRGQRLSDLRRLVRQYDRLQQNVFPSGQHYKGGSYGSDVNFPVPDTERSNPQFTGCLNRNA
jgi:hypothetical protein